MAFWPPVRSGEIRLIAYFSSGYRALVLARHPSPSDMIRYIPVANPGVTADMRRKLSKAEIRKRARAGAYHDGSKPLTAKKIARLKGDGNYHDALVPGLYLQVTTTTTTGAAKSWLLRYEMDGRPERRMGLGSLKVFSLAQARDRAREARRLIADGIDPIDARHRLRADARAAAAKRLTFREAAEAYFNAHQAEWSSAEHRADFLGSLRNHVHPHIGDLDVAAIETAHILKVLQPIWLVKTATAARMRQRIEQVLDYATVGGHRPAGAPNPARWKGHLDQLLAKPSRAAPITHHRAIDYRELPAFMTALRARDGIAARALEFLILTSARTDEVLGATWAEINLAEAVWLISAARMKAGRDHRVALSPAAIALLRALPRERDNPYCFIGSQPGRGLGGLALARTLSRMGCSATVHGFRSTFSDWSHEQTAHPNHAIEISLAHRVGSDVEKAYRRGDMFAKRIWLMTDWAKYCSSPPAAMADNVTAIGAGR